MNDSAEQNLEAAIPGEPQGIRLDRSSSCGPAITAACLIEAVCPKPGNVHRGADFENSTFYDFVISASVIGPVFDLTGSRSLGQLIEDAVSITREYVGTNTNLGMILLMAPLAKLTESVSCSERMKFPQRAAELSEGMVTILKQAGADDCRLVYQAINCAQAGGMGKVADADLNSAPSDLTLVKAMELAKDRDTIAELYATGYGWFFQRLVPMMMEEFRQNRALPEAMTLLHLRILAELPDTLIARKLGRPFAESVSARAAEIVNGFAQAPDDYSAAVADFDFWLRSDGHRRNPGTTADLIAAGLFFLIRTGWLSSDRFQAILRGCRNVPTGNGQMESEA